MNTHKLAASLAFAAVAVAGMAVTTDAAHADPGSKGCVTRAEFKKVHTSGRKAQTRPQVTRLFGVRGHITSSGSGGTDVEYPTCQGDRMWSYAEVDFYHKRAYFKWIYISR